MGAFTRWYLKKASEVEEEFYDRARAAFPERRVDGVQVYGCDAFVEEVSEALSALRTAYPYSHRLVQRYLSGIVESSAKRRGSQVLGVYYQRTTEAGRLPSSPKRIAAAFVRHAATTRLIRGFGIPRSRRRQLATLKRELRVMKILNCHPFYFDFQNAQIAVREKD